MAKHKYAAGDRVIAVASRSDIRPVVYTIIRRLPITGPGCQYRVRNALDPHERVLDEDLLQHANG